MQSAIQSIINLIHRAQSKKPLERIDGTQLIQQNKNYTSNTLPPLPSRIPNSLSAYKVHLSLGEGGFGKLFLATHLPTQTLYALKHIPIHKISPKRFTHHDNLGWVPVEVYALMIARGVEGVIGFVEMLRVGGDLVIVQEVFGEVWNQGVDGSFYENALRNLMEEKEDALKTHSMDLFEFLTTHTLKTHEVRIILRQIVRTVVALGERGIIHGDIKDENILIDAKLEIRLIDFGGASIDKHHKHGEARKRLNARDFHGTMEFASPEVLRGDWYDPEKADVWAIGTLVYGMCFGGLAFVDKEASMTKDAFESCLEDVGKDGELRCGDVELIAFMRRCFEKDEAKRMGFREMSEFVL